MCLLCQNLKSQISAQDQVIFFDSHQLNMHTAYSLKKLKIFAIFPGGDPVFGLNYTIVAPILLGLALTLWIVAMILYFRQRQTYKKYKDTTNEDSFLIQRSLNDGKISKIKTNKQIDVSQYRFDRPNSLVYTNDAAIRGEVATVRPACYSIEAFDDVTMSLGGVADVKVAVKTYPQNRKTNFDDELAIFAWLRKFKHENILTLIGWFEMNEAIDGYSILTQHIPGGTLREYLQKANNVDWRQMCMMAMSIVDAVAFLHGTSSVKMAENSENGNKIL